LEKPEWWKVCESQDLKRFIVEMSRTFTQNIVIQEDLQQEAWLKICEFLGGLDARAEGNTGSCVSTSADGLFIRNNCAWDVYMRIAFKAMDALYHREWRQWEKNRKLMNRLQKRQSRIRKKYRFLVSK